MEEFLYKAEMLGHPNSVTRKKKEECNETFSLEIW